MSLDLPGEPTTNDHNEEPGYGGGGALRLLLPALLMALLAGAVFYLTKNGCSKPVEAEQTIADTTSVTSREPVTMMATGKVDSLSGDFMYDQGENTTIELPNNGGKLTIGKNSTEFKLIQFLNDHTAMIDTVKGNWFEFTDVHFKSGGAELINKVNTQLQNLVTIAKAYPAAQFKFGGYTDTTGDKAKNLLLSQKRADAVAEKVKELGATNIVGATGYGDQWPIADNATVEGRAQNRRVAINVKAK